MQPTKHIPDTTLTTLIVICILFGVTAAAPAHEINTDTTKRYTSPDNPNCKTMYGKPCAPGPCKFPSINVITNENCRCDLVILKIFLLLKNRRQKSKIVSSERLMIYDTHFCGKKVVWF